MVAGRPDRLLNDTTCLGEIGACELEMVEATPTDDEDLPWAQGYVVDEGDADGEEEAASDDDESDDDDDE